jgi:hypothetical protein
MAGVPIAFNEVLNVSNFFGRKSFGEARALVGGARKRVQLLGSFGMVFAFLLLN